MISFNQTWLSKKNVFLAFLCITCNIYVHQPQIQYNVLYKITRNIYAHTRKKIKFKKCWLFTTATHTHAKIFNVNGRLTLNYFVRILFGEQKIKNSLLSTYLCSIGSLHLYTNFTYIIWYNNTSCLLGLHKKVTYLCTYALFSCVRTIVQLCWL